MRTFLLTGALASMLTLHPAAALAAQGRPVARVTPVEAKAGRARAADKAARAPTSARHKSKAAASRKPVATLRGKIRRPRWAPVELWHVNRRERLWLRVADERGRPVRNLHRQTARFFRCHYTNKEHRIDPRLVRLIYEVGKHYDGKRIEVVSGYRHPSVAKNPKSPHREGHACDFRVVGVKNAELRDYLRSAYKKNVGIGYYPNSGFVHLDVREGRPAFWIDYSGPGQDSLYSEDAAADVRTGRADSFRPAAVDPALAASAQAERDTKAP